MTSQLKSKFHVVEHDKYIGQNYIDVLSDFANKEHKPILAEAPFSISKTKDPLEHLGYKVIPIFIIEPEPVLRDRYFAREKKTIPQGHVTRMKTYAERAKEWNAFRGTSKEVLEHLKAI